MANPLDEENVFQIMSSVIFQDVTPPHTTTIKSAIEALALFTHACLLALEFRLVGLSEDDNICAANPNQESSTSRLPPGWSSSPTFFSFRYAHAQSAMQFLIRLNRMGSKAIVMGMGIGDDKVSSFEIVLADYFSESYFPHEVPTNGNVDALREAFNSTWRTKDLITLLKVKIIQPLVPSLQKEGYDETGDTATGSNGGSARNQMALLDPPPRGTYTPLRTFPTGPRNPDEPPGFEDEFQLLPGARPSISPVSSNPFNIGHDDLNPPGLGGYPSFRGPFLGDGTYHEGGMFPGPNHPMFGGEHRNRNDGRFPLGSRYDPIGPGDLPSRPMGQSRGSPFCGYGSSDFI